VEQYLNNEPDDAKLTRQVRKILMVDVFTHVSDNKRKAELLASMIAQVVVMRTPEGAEIMESDDRDNYRNKRIDGLEQQRSQPHLPVADRAGWL
jgi:DNA-directed RNA polymerase beta subunit